MTDEKFAPIDVCVKSHMQRTNVKIININHQIQLSETRPMNNNSKDPFFSDF